MHAMRHVPLWNSCKVCIRAPSDSAPPPTKALGCGGRRFGGLDDDTQCLEPLSPEIQLLGFRGLGFGGLGLGFRVWGLGV